MTEHGLLTRCVAFLLVWLVSNDALFTLFHMTFHEVAWLYRIVHKEHHTWKHPFVWMSHAMTPYEAGANGIALMFYPVVHSLWLGRTTSLELVWLCQLLGQLIGCIEHSGHGNLHPLLVDPKRFPIWLLSTTKHHDDHHLHFRGNYGGYLAIWDTLLGTRIPEGAASYRERRTFTEATGDARARRECAAFCAIASVTAALWYGMGEKASLVWAGALGVWFTIGRFCVL